MKSIRHTRLFGARAGPLSVGALGLLLQASCVMAPMGSFQDPRTVPDGEVEVGAGAVVMPLVFNGEGGPDDKGMLLGEFDLWLDVGTAPRRDIRVQLTLEAIWEDPDSRSSPALLLAGATVEGKLANRAGTSAFLIGTTIWVPFVDSTLFGDSMNSSGSERDAPANYSPFIPWPTFNLGHSHELAAGGEIRLLITSHLNTIFIAYLGATGRTSLALHVPLGDAVALRPEIFASCMVLSTYMTRPARFFNWSCGGGAALGLEF